MREWSIGEHIGSGVIEITCWGNQFVTQECIEVTHSKCHHVRYIPVHVKLIDNLGTPGHSTGKHRRTKNSLLTSWSKHQISNGPNFFSLISRNYICHAQ